MESQSGPYRNIYSVLLEGREETLFETFFWDNLEKFRVQVENIADALETIGNNHIRYEQYFKVAEGSNPLVPLHCLFDHPGKRLRVFAIHWDEDTIIMGGGGLKNKPNYREIDYLNEQSRLMEAIYTHLRKLNDCEDDFQFPLPGEDLKAIIIDTTHLP